MLNLSRNLFHKASHPIDPLIFSNRAVARESGYRIADFVRHINLFCRWRENKHILCLSSSIHFEHGVHKITKFDTIFSKI